MPNELMKTLTIGANTYDLPQKTSDLTNDSGFLDEAVLLVTVSYNDETETMTADHTYTEINTAFNNGKTILVVRNNSIYQLGGYHGVNELINAHAAYSFHANYVNTNGSEVMESLLIIDDTNTWTDEWRALPIPTKTSELTNNSGFITSESDPTVPSWAKASSKPSYTASEVGAAASSHTHGNITNGGDITTNATIANGDRLVINDESASKITNSSITFGSSTAQYLANNGTWQNVPTVPTKTSDLTNDSNFISSTTADNTYVPKTSTILGNTNSITYNSSQGSHSINLATSGYGKAQLKLIANADGNSSVVISAGSSTATNIITAGYNYTSSNTYTTISSTNTTINGVVTPTADGMAANKKYVDDSITAAIGTAIGGSY